MKKIQFDCKYRPEIESGKYTVQTRGGRPARIICWDKKAYGGRHEIVALVPTEQGDTETCQMYNPDGTLIASTRNERYRLEILTDEPELSEFEEEICGITNLNLSFSMTDEVKDAARRVLDLARKELEPEFDAAYKNQDEIVFRNGVKKGKEEAMKDMPRWSDSNMNDYYSKNRYEIIRMGGGTLYLVDLCMNKKIRISDLRMLPGLVD